MLRCSGAAVVAGGKMRHQQQARCNTWRLTVDSLSYTCCTAESVLEVALHAELPPGAAKRSHLGTKADDESKTTKAKPTPKQLGKQLGYLHNLPTEPDIKTQTNS